MGSSNVRVFPASTQVPPIVTELEAIFAELPDEDLIAKLKGNRRLGRPGYDPAKLWRAFVVYYYMGLPSVSDLIRTLYDNPYIASVCGFASPDEIPHQSTFSRFGSKLAKPKFTLAVKNIVRSFTRRFYEELPGFGKSVAIDSTDIKGWSSAAKARAGNAADKDAGWVVKLGTDGRKKYVWGYKVHILCDTTWELPLAVDTSAGNVHDLKKATPLLAQARYAHSKFNPDYVICDAAYSDRKLRSTIRWQYWARPIIDPNPTHKRLVAKTKKTPEWKMIYNRRVAVERLNGRLKGHRKLNSLRVRGRAKVRIHAMMATVVCQAQAMATGTRNLVRSVLTAA